MTEPPSQPLSGHDEGFAREALPEMEAVFRFALRLSGQRDLAEDLVQETYLRAWRSWNNYTPGTRIRSWLFTICRNVFFRSEERSRRHDEIVTQVAGEDPGAVALDAAVFRDSRDHDPESAFWARIVDAQVLQALEALPPEFREALILADLEELPYDEIATILGVARGTVKSRVFRARRLLQVALHDYAVSQGIIPARDESGTAPPATSQETT